MMMMMMMMMMINRSRIRSFEVVSQNKQQSSLYAHWFPPVWTTVMLPAYQLQKLQNIVTLPSTRKHTVQYHNAHMLVNNVKVGKKCDCFTNRSECLLSYKLWSFFWNVPGFSQIRFLQVPHHQNTSQFCLGVLKGMLFRKARCTPSLEICSRNLWYLKG